MQTRQRGFYFFHAALALATALALPQAVHAQAQDYPNKPIRIIVGPGTDILARMVGEKLTEAWGQAVVIDPRPAAGGIVAGDAVAKAPADGYTLLLSSSSYTANHVLQAKMPYDLTTDLAPVNLIATIPIVVVAGPAVPVNNLKELAAAAKAKPGQFNFASAGNGTAPHLAGEMFKQQAHVDLTHVPYKGAAPAVTDVMGGQVQLMFSTAPSVLPMIQGKKLKALGVTGTKRYKGLPDVQSAAEQGYPEFSYLPWNGIHAPAKTPPAVIEKLAAKINEIMRTANARERAEVAGFEPVTFTTKEFAQFQEQDLARLRVIIKGGNIKAD